MIEGDPSVVDWQTWEDWHNAEPKAPEGMVPAGPWFPFAAVPISRGGDGSLCSCVIYRRPLKRAEEWVPIASLPKWVLFEAKTGDVGIMLAEQLNDRVSVVWLERGHASVTASLLVRRLPKP